MVTAAQQQRSQFNMALQAASVMRPVSTVRWDRSRLLQQHSNCLQHFPGSDKTSAAWLRGPLGLGEHLDFRLVLKKLLH